MAVQPIVRVLEAFADCALRPSGDSGKEWVALCPAHDDHDHSLAIGVGNDDTVVLTCYANCPTEAVLAARGLTWKDLFPLPDVPRLSQLAAMKRLPVEFLSKQCGLRDLDNNLGIGIPCDDEKFIRLCLRRRVKLYGANHTMQQKGKRLVAYGQPRLVDARKAGELVIVEGESDAWTLWYHGFCALGLPGASASKPLLAEHVRDVKTVYVWQEHGEAGAGFVEKVARRLQKFGRLADAKLVRSDRWKDPSELHIADPDGFKVAFHRLLAAAVSLPEPSTRERHGRKFHVPGVVTQAVTVSSPSGNGVHLNDCPPPSPPTARQYIPGPSPGYFGLTDAGNARRLVYRHGADIRYVQAWRNWLVWESGVWFDHADAQVMRKAKETVQRIYAEAAACNDAAPRQRIVEHAIASESARALHAMMDLAKSEPSVDIHHTQLDRSPWLLNCPNGTVDLRTGSIREPCREDLITKRCVTPYQPDAACPAWEKFLLEVFAGNAALVEYVQRLLGYCLTGDVSTHLLAVFWGSGGNGKGTMLNTFLRIIGDDYSGASAADLLLSRRGERHPTEIADLFGKRLVVCQETDEGCRLNESLVKWLTGGDLLKARRMRENFWQFVPTHKLILSTNYRPAVRGTDKGIWRRLRLIPFTVIFEGKTEDRLLPFRLFSEAAGILAWAVRGCLSWHSDGEQVPQEVLAATDNYRNEEDIVQRFVNEDCTVGPNRECRASYLYARFQQWLEQSGEHINVSKNRFGRRLADLGFIKHKNNGTVYQGIAGRTEEKAAEQAQSETTERKIVPSDMAPYREEVCLQTGENRSVPSVPSVQNADPTEGTERFTQGSQKNASRIRGEPERNDKSFRNFLEDLDGESP